MFFQRFCTIRTSEPFAALAFGKKTKTGDAGFKAVLEQTHAKYFDQLRRAETSGTGGEQLSFITDPAIDGSDKS